MGRILWEYAQAHEASRLPFAYLAFDQPTLRIEAPFTLLVEAAAQFELQLPEKLEGIERFRNDVRTYRDSLHAVRTRSLGSPTWKLRIGTVRGYETDLFRSFAALLRAVGLRTSGRRPVQIPILLALDSFEEVQYRDRENLEQFWLMLDEIQEAHSPVRFLICGRAPISSLGANESRLTELALHDLDPDDRLLLLNRLGITDPRLGTALAEQVGGNPLSLRLAADLVKSDPGALTPEGIDGLATRRWVLFRVDEGLIQGQLYRRILDHIHDEKVRMLAHPGMVLRRVDPEVILEVIAPACGVHVAGMEEARRLFEELRRENTLVTEGRNDSLIYRPEIRSAMLRLLQQDRYAQVHSLHRAAIEYYSSREGIAARGEELYHRLMLAEDDSQVLDKRWMEGVEASLVKGLEEYPDRGKVWLASRTNVHLTREAFMAATAEEWERNVTRKVQRSLSVLDTETALNLLSERPERSANSPLFALQAKAHILREDLHAAWQVLDKGIEHVPASRNGGRLAELCWLQSQVALMRGDPALADELLERAETAVSGGNSLVPRIHVLGQRLFLRTVHSASYRTPAADLRDRLNRWCARFGEKAAYEAPFVLHLASTMLGNEYPGMSGRLRSFISIPGRALDPDILTSENLEGLEEYKAPWEMESDAPEEARA